MQPQKGGLGQWDVRTLQRPLKIILPLTSLARSLAGDVPAELLTSTREVSGSPDAQDPGGIVPEITRDGKTGRFYLDNNEDALPAALVPYAQPIKRGMAALK
jgi:hypothetical protein